MKYQFVINNILSNKWHYISDKNLLVLFVGSTDNLTSLSLIDEEGYLNVDFKNELTTTLQEKGVLGGTVGPFGDEDYFSGIKNKDQLHYYFEVHNVTPEILEKFEQHFSIVPTISQ